MRHFSVHGVGEVKLTDNITLKHVLYIPDFKCNLLSISWMTVDHNYFFTFFVDCCLVQDLPTRNLIGQGRQGDRLYFLISVQGGRVVMTTRRFEDSQVWHKRLGHPSREKMLHLSFLHDQLGNKLQYDSCFRAK